LKIRAIGAAAAAARKRGSPCCPFGEPRVNVLELNLAVEKAFPKK
jgi:K+-transporting ATPase c subunit